MMIRRALIALTVFCLIPGLAAAAEEKKKDNKTTYVPIDTLTAMVMASNGRHAVLTVQSGVDVPDPALNARALSVTPRLRDAYVQVLQTYAGGLQPGAPPDPEYVGRRLQQVTDQVLGKPGGKFLFGGIMVN